MFLEDARNISKMISEKLIDVIITSPPYGDLKDYDAEHQIGYGQNYLKEYLPSLESVFKQCYDITKDTGSLWIVADTFKKKGTVQLLPFQIAEICSKAGWKLSDIIIWDKGKTLPWSHKGRLRNTFEYILLFIKSKNYKFYVDRIKDPVDLKEWWVKYPERYSLQGKVPSNIWRIPIPVQGSWSQGGFEHYCPFPPELVERIIMLCSDPGDVIMDPFFGSGVVLAQAQCMNRAYIGFEINKEYVDVFQKKTLPAVKARWEDVCGQTTSMEQKRREFEQNIRKLRILKYPKMLAKKLIQTHPEESGGIEALVVLENKEKKLSPKELKTKFAGVNIYIVTNARPSVLDKFRNEIDHLQRIPPLSKFGLISKVKLISRRRALAVFLKMGEVSNDFYFYVGGKVHSYNKRVSLNEIAMLLFLEEWGYQKKMEFPLIISPIGIEQQIKHTWFQKGLPFNENGGE